MCQLDSLTIDDVTGQAVPESGTGRTECLVTDGLFSLTFSYVDIYQLTSKTSMCSSELESQIFASSTAKRCCISVSLAAIVTTCK